MVETDVVSVDEVLHAVQDRWPLPAVRLQALTGGMNSHTWTVRPERDDHSSAQRCVAKLVRPDQRDAFVRGLHAAALVDAAGIPAGRPLPTRDGHDHVDLPGGTLAVLHWVQGTRLAGTRRDDHVLIGTTLGAAHLALVSATHPSAQAFPRWLDPDAGHLAVQDWVRPAVRAALADYRALDPSDLQFGLLHGDPEPEAFLRAATPHRTCALIDWSSAEHGPFLYDVASALVYVGGPQRGRALLEAYASTVGARGADLTAGVGVLLTLRQAVQADYFARRLATGDLTGITSREENLQGLHAAERFFTESAKRSSSGGTAK